MFITFSCSVYNVYYTAVTQQMDNVAFSCLLAMANVAVSYCRDGLWARCLLTHSHCNVIYSNEKSIGYTPRILVLVHIRVTVRVLYTN